MNKFKVENNIVIKKKALYWHMKMSFYYNNSRVIFQVFKDR